MSFDERQKIDKLFVQTWNVIQQIRECNVPRESVHKHMNICAHVILYILLQTQNRRKSTVIITVERNTLRFVLRYIARDRETLRHFRTENGITVLLRIHLLYVCVCVCECMQHVYLPEVNLG